MIGDAGETTGRDAHERARHAAAAAQAQAAAARRARDDVPPPDDAVVIERERTGAYAGLATRALAYAIDLVLINLAAVIAGVAVALVASVVHRMPDGLRTALTVALAAAYVVWLVGYFAFFWSATGQTPGCRVMHIRVVDAVGRGTIGIRRGIVRFAGIVLATIPLLAGFVIMLWDARRRCLQDRIARTVVVHAQPRAVVRRAPEPP